MVEASAAEASGVFYQAAQTIFSKPGNLDYSLTGKD
jgi:hypothetical protein